MIVAVQRNEHTNPDPSEVCRMAVHLKTSAGGHVQTLDAWKDSLAGEHLGQRWTTLYVTEIKLENYYFACKTYLSDSIITTKVSFHVFLPSKHCYIMPREINFMVEDWDTQDFYFGRNLKSNK